MNHINITGYDRDAKIDAAADEFLKPLVERAANLAASFLLNQRPGGHRKMKIHLVTLHSVDSGKPERTYLVKAHTRQGAEKYVIGKVRGFIEAKVPTQQELVDALQSGTIIEDATNSTQASIPEPAQTQE